MLTWILGRWLGRRQKAAATREPSVTGADLIFRLKAWPQLPESGRTAEIYRMLSVMSSQPVNRHWLLTRVRIAPQQLDQLLQHLVREGALEVIDPSRFGARLSQF